MEGESSQKVVPLEDYLKLIDEYDRLRQIYEKLKTKHGQCKPYIDEAITKYQGARNVAQQWHDWYEQHGEAFREFNEARKAAKSETLDDERNVTSSQTTECEQAYVRHDDTARCSSEEPEVISVRSLTRRRSKPLGPVDDRVRIKVEPTSQTSPIELASEDFSSPVLKRNQPVRTETSDLDAHIEPLNTPRKQKTTRAQSEEATRPTSLLAATSSLSEGNVPDALNDSLCIKAEATNTAHQGDITKTRDFAFQGNEGIRGRSVLRQRSVNIPSMPYKNNARSSNLRKRKAELATLAEDGDDQASQTAPLRYRPNERRDLRHRLDDLLDVPSPDRPPLEPRASSTRTFEKPRKAASLLEKSGCLSEEPHMPSSITLKRTNGLEKSPPPPEPEDEPLRARPLKMLCLDDFKINPNYLGSKYAFADTFRGREQRRCLPGCTRPDCCGNSFKEAVQAGMIKSTKTDDQVLEEYLGPDWATHMYALGPAKRKDLIIQARSYAFANEHGKHRDAFARRSTPPGFWRVDMPSTQEEAQDRARAIDLEREKVEDRWREAMRGGRWMFRDES